MSDTKRMMKLGAMFVPTGHHVTSWRHPDAQADAGVNVHHWVEMARLAERAKFDMIFFADSAQSREGHMDALSRSAQYIAALDPMVLLPALAMVTEKIGLVSTMSTSFNEPYHVARAFASLDILSAGRAGWNIVTSTTDNEARNFGRDTHLEHEERYDRAREFTQVVLGLWDSWDDDAFVRDKASGLFFEPAARHVLNHKGKHFSVRGPLNVPRATQGYPLLVQAGASDTGRGFAAQFAEAIFTAHLTLAESQEFYGDVKARVEDAGRNPNHVIVLPGLSVMVGRTHTEAQVKFDSMQSLVHPMVAREIASFTLGRVDLSAYDINGLVPELPEPNGSISAFRTAMKMAREEQLTIAQLGVRLAAARQRFHVTGTPRAYRRRDGGVVHRGRCGRVQHLTAVHARCSARFRRSRGARAATPRTLPNGI